MSMDMKFEIAKCIYHTLCGSLWTQTKLAQEVTVQLDIGRVLGGYLSVTGKGERGRGHKVATAIADQKLLVGALRE